MANLPMRLRAFVLDRTTGKPIAKVVVAAIAELKGPDGETREITIGLLQSDHVGYLSFDLSKLPPLANPNYETTSGLWVSLLHDANNRIEVLSKITDAIETTIITISTDQPAKSGKSEDPQLPSIQGCPDEVDWKVSPYSVSAEDMLIVGEPGCEALLLSKAVERMIRFSQLVRKPEPAPKVLSPAAFDESESNPKREFGRALASGLEQFSRPRTISFELGSTHRGIPIAPVTTIDNDVQGTAMPVSPLAYRIGALLEYEMTWQPVGHGLGRVLYSLPLAPCESVKLAIIDWAREDKSIRGEVTGINENLLHNQYRGREIDEAVDATLREWQRGSSFMGGTAGVGGFGNGMWGITGSHAIGTGSFKSSGSRTVAANTTQELSDQIAQASSLTRRLNSTVIVHASQAERERIETRTVTNHNHCHSLTVLYYEVVRHYCVMTRLAKKQDVILVEYPVVEFDQEMVLRYGRVLERVLLDESLRKCFDVVKKLHCMGIGFDPSTVVLAPDDFEMRTLRIRTTTGANGGGGAAFRQVEIRTKIPGEVVACRVTDPPPLAAGREEWYLPRESMSRQEHFFTLELARPVRWGNVAGIAFNAVTLSGISGDLTPWDLAYLHAMTSHDRGDWILYNKEVGQPIAVGNPPVVLDVDSYGGPRRPEDTLSKEERCCIDLLLRHLNDNATYYNRAIWLAEDPDERARRFDMYQYEDGRLIDFIENRPVGVSGDYVAFPLGNDNSFADSIINAATERIISLPTRGAFAEAKLSHCNACEKRDPTRFWKWQESPCPETPPDITGITPGSRARDIIGTPTTLPAPGIGIETPPEAPAPTGMDKVMDLLGKPEIFRDMSGRGELGALLGQLVAAAAEVEKSRMENQTELEKARIEAKTGQRAGGGTRTDTTTGSSSGGVESLSSLDGRSYGAGSGSAGTGFSTYAGTTRRTTRVNPDGSVVTEQPTPEEGHDLYTALGAMGFSENEQRDIIRTQYHGGTPASTEEYEKLVAFHPNYLVFRARVGWTLHDVMIYRSRIYRGGARQPEIVIDRRPDLRNIHEGYTTAGAQDGDPIRLLLYLARDEQDNVILIRIAAPDVERSPGIIVPGESPTTTEAARNAWTDLFRPYTSRIRTGPEAATGDDRYGVALPHLGWLEGYKDSMRIILRVSITDPRIDPTTLEVQESLLPQLQRDWAGDPADEPTDRLGARQALETWNQLETEERRAIRAPSRMGALIEEMERLFDSENERLSGPISSAPTGGPLVYQT